MTELWPADRVERRPVSCLTPYARNARTHSDQQVAQIAASIREWGWTMPVLVDEEGGIIAGHGRILAAQRLGLAEVPVMEARGWSEAQKRAYVLADNKLTLNAGWDEELLRLELGELKFSGFDLDLTGFSGDELAAYLSERSEGLTTPDEAPEPPADPVTVLGDVWLLGRHRLACGDCTTVEAVDAALGGVKPHLMVTDPPYGVNYDPGWRSSLDQWNQATNAVSNDDKADWREAWSLFPGDVAYIWHAGLHGHVMQQSLDAAGFSIRSQIIWVKPHFALSRGDYHVQHEPCFYAVRRQKAGHWAGDRKQSTVWHIANNTFQGGKLGPEDVRSGHHGTQKPVECMRRPIENNSSPGQAVYEPFSGSGTTIIAAEMTGRVCHAIELSPPYCDASVIRWQNFTGKQATLESDGRTFDDVREERLAHASA